MTQDELNKLVSEFLPYPSTGQHHALKRFAQIVAEAEREACAKLMFDLDLCGREGVAHEEILKRGQQ